MNIAIAPQETKTFTIKEIFEAIEHNGFKHLREEWVSYNAKNKAVGACVLGQAALNLGAITNSEADETYNIYTDYSDDYDQPEIKTLLEQLNQFDTPEKWSDGDEEIDKAGNAIVYWNDKHVTDEDGNSKLTPSGKPIYELKKYEDVVKMAREILEPYFDKTIELTHYEY